MLVPWETLLVVLGIGMTEDVDDGDDNDELRPEVLLPGALVDGVVRLDDMLVLVVVDDCTELEVVLDVW